MAEGSDEISSEELDQESLDDDPTGGTEEGMVDQDLPDSLSVSSDATDEDMESSSIDDEEAETAIIAPDEPELIPAATLFREGVTGRIVVDVNGRQYFDLESLKNSKDWSRVKSLSTDFTNWIEDMRTPGSLEAAREGKDVGSSSEAHVLRVPRIWLWDNSLFFQIEQR